MTRKEHIQNTVLNLKALIIAMKLQDNPKLNPHIKTAKSHQKKMNACLKIIKLSELKHNSISPDFDLVDKWVEDADKIVDSIGRNKHICDSHSNKGDL